ncbi:MAG TPA: TetR/AcrR family transcriptional regulator [Streptosporangiaceae bacterium]|jgi:AcrR family transcriptional regulator
MTDSQSGQATAVERRPGKRERLIAAATRLLHEQGVERTTLADIAKAADVPAGNVYYYFKAKDDVVGAVIEAHVQQIKATLASIEARHRSPKPRLKAFVREFTAQSEIVAQFGCPLGSLCSELDKRVTEPGLPAAELMRLPIEWAEGQFRSLGRADARDLAFDLLAAYEGSALLANTMRDPGILSGAARRIDRWIDTL